MSSEPTQPTASPEEGGPNLRFTNRPDGSLNIEVDHDYEGVVRQIDDLVSEESGKLWLHIGEVIERLMPGISPYDKREAVSEILAPVKQVFIDAFW